VATEAAWLKATHLEKEEMKKKEEKERKMKEMALHSPPPQGVSRISIN
jgi:hypothetical protein